MAWACFVSLLLVAMLRKSPLTYGDLSEIQERLGEAPEVKS
jgi:hypothetical protein